ncbi:MAG: hypothetical protein MJA29_08125, partial [Candidatus Omnitrophica bacterium]|nr:hypothetical protein [Candidatus Omnitrophota bacterium]
ATKSHKLRVEKYPRKPLFIKPEEIEQYSLESKPKPKVKSISKSKTSRKPKDNGQEIDYEILTEIKKIEGVEILDNFSNVTLKIRIDKEATNTAEYKDKLIKVLSKITEFHHKISVSLKAQFHKDRVDDEDNEVIHGIQAKMAPINSQMQAKEMVVKQLNYIKTEIEERYFQGSGLSLDKILFCELWICCYKPTKGGHFVALPFKTKVIINVKCADDKCFLWSLLAALYPPTNHRCDESSYRKYQDNLKIDANFPICIQKDLHKIEKDNNLKINIFGLKTPSKVDFTIKDCTLEPLYLSADNEVDRVTIDLLYYKEHYMCLKDINIFYNKSDGHKKYLCKTCMNAFSSDSALENHIKKCKDQDYCEIKLPTLNKSNLKFKNHHFKNRVPFVVYADFESINCKIDKEETASETSTKKLYHQKAAAVAVYIYSDYPNLYQSKYKFHRGEDVIDVFCNFMIELDRTLWKLLKTNISLQMTEDDEINFQNSENCYYCGDELNEVGASGAVKNDRVRDHNHFSGKYRGAAHNQCNLNARKVNFVPVFFHNLSHYDAHLFIKQLLTKLTSKQKEYFKLLAKNSEDYISFQFGCLRFLDSY